MKVAIIVESFPMKEIFIYRHINLLKADVVASYVDDFDLHDWNWRPYVASTSKQKPSRKKLLDRALRKIKEITIGLPVSRWSDEMDSIWDEYVKLRKPDVAMAEFGPTGISAMEACKRHGIPLVVHFHGYDASSMLRHKIYQQNLPYLFRHSAAVIVVSQWMKRKLESIGCPQSKLHVIPCGAPVEEFPLSQAVINQPCRYLTAASFTPVKGSLFTLRAFAYCAKKCSDVSMTMIGEGKEFHKAKKLARKLKIKVNTSFPGHQPIEIVREYLNKCSVFVQHSVTTSLGHMEGWGVSIAEAASSGLPVIATNHGGIPEQVIDGVTGYLVDECDWKGMGEKMIELACNPELRRKMGLAGRRNIENVGNLKIQIKKLSEVLREAAVPKTKYEI